MKGIKSIVQKSKFIQAAVSTDETRLFMNLPYYDAEANAIVGIDGRRLHVWYPEKYELDFFDHSKSSYVQFVPIEPFVMPINREWQFPNWKRVIPEMKPAFEVFMHDDFWKGAFYLAVKAILNDKYLKPLEEESWSVTPGSDYSRAIRFDKFDQNEKPLLSAVIMPLHGDSGSTIEDAVKHWIKYF